MAAVAAVVYTALLVLLRWKAESTVHPSLRPGSPPVQLRFVANTLRVVQVSLWVLLVKTLERQVMLVRDLEGWRLWADPEARWAAAEVVNWTEWSVFGVVLE